LAKLSLSKAFMLLEPGPVLLLATATARKQNIMTLSWHMVLDFTPRFAFITGDWNHSCRALARERECVIAVPGVDLARTVVAIGACSGADTDKFEKFALTPLRAKAVKAPLVGECLANIECRVVDHVRKHDLFVVQALRAWVNPGRRERRMFHAVGDGTFITDGRKFSLRDVMRGKLPPGV
jgi:flavin reductase (DIM6/NTAB) family NADH-FMN oxidoreductase RutF